MLVQKLEALLAEDTAALSGSELLACAEAADRIAVRCRSAHAVRTPQAEQGGPVYSALCSTLLGTARQDVYGDHAPVQLDADHSAPHTNVPPDFLRSLMSQLRPTFLVEVGSWKGGSALLIADAAVEATPPHAPPPTLLCIDTWLGDGATWLDRCVGWREGLLLNHGLPQVFWQFVANCRRRADVIFPWPLASLTALRALQHLAIRGAVPQPDFVYLDAAHEKGETLIEIRRAFELLRPGGVLVGDDLDWPAVEVRRWRRSAQSAARARASAPERWRR